jgi:hypothetical protein
VKRHLLLVLAVALPAVALARGPVHYTQMLGYGFRAKFGILEETWKTAYPKAAEQDPEAVRDFIRQVFLSYVEKPREVKVELAPTTQEQLAQGRFAWIRFSFQDGLFDSIPVKRLESEFRDVQLNVHDLTCVDRIRLIEHKKIDYYVEVTEADMNTAVFTSGGKLKNVRNPRMELNENSIRFSGGVKRLFGYTNVRVDGMLKVVDKNKINFVPSALKVGVVPLPGFVTREIFQRINPLADLGRLNMNAPPDHIIVRPDRVCILTDAYKHLLPPGAEPK